MKSKNCSSAVVQVAVHKSAVQIFLTMTTSQQMDFVSDIRPYQLYI